MTRFFLLLFLSLSLLSLSCSSISLKSRKGLDMYLSSDSCHKLSGNYRNVQGDTSENYITLYHHFHFEKRSYRDLLTANLNVIDKNTIQLKFLFGDFVVDSLTLKGKFRKGYFRMDRQWDADFIAGPLVWIIGDNYKYIGLTKENKLVIVDSGRGGVLLLVFFPAFGAESGQYESEFERLPIQSDSTANP